jgi:hypothetical protein
MESLYKLERLWRDQKIRLKKVLADKAYSLLIPIVKLAFGWRMATPDTRPSGSKGFVVQKHRWVIERTVASSTAFSYLASIHRLASRLS